ncbi:MAG: DUF58 domain-containing protein [Candidatus Bathyarchaeota archaeon]|nr:DUF58 domain-containing protein [Candidatus Bathyarchaeota archaeon]
MASHSFLILKIYFVIVLLGGTLVSPLPLFGLALALLLLQVYTAAKPPQPSANIAITIATLIFAPLTLTMLVGEWAAVLFILPGIELLDLNLQANKTSPSAFSKVPRRATTVSKTLVATLAVAFLAALTLQNITLLLAAFVVLIYLAAILGYSLHKIPLNPLKETNTWNRIIVGNTANNHTKITSKTSLPLTATLTSTEPWVVVEPKKLIFTNQTPEKISLTYTPPLAGPSSLQLQAITLDPRGLLQHNQTLEPLSLHIIPRAKYARWLAEKYLKQTTSGTTTAAILLPRALKTAKQGIEYFGNRLYSPGDRLRDVDWKHTIMLNELITKEFTGAQGQPNIIVADLMVNDAEGADQLAYNMVMAALTSAMAALPAGLAVYNQKKVIAATPPEEPAETLKKTLNITQKIVVQDPPLKLTKPPELVIIKKTIRDLNQTQTQPAQKLAEMMQFEYEAIFNSAKTHPAMQALNRAISKTPPPATLTVVSKFGYDADALIVSLELLKNRGYGNIRVSTD